MLNIFKIFSLSFLAVILVGCNSSLLNQADDQEQELAAEAEIDDEKTPEEVWEDLAKEKTKK
jgi:hypothetical protein